MAIIPNTRGNPQASDVAVQDALPMVGSSSREDLQSTLNFADAELAKLFENENILLAEGGTLSWSTTSGNLTFTAALKLHINSQVAGGSPTIVDLTSTTRAFSADGRMLYAVIDRDLGTAVITADSTTLPAVVAANQEVILLAKRVGNDLYFRNGFKLVDKQSATLSGDYNESIANDTSTGTAQTLAAVNTGIIRLTNSGLVSVVGIPAGRTGQKLVVINATGTAVTFLEDNTGASANDRLYLNLSGAITLLDQGALIFTYDSTDNKWVIGGGSGSGSGTGFKNILSDINSKFPGGIADWITYDDGAVSAPVDGTGGSPSAITIAGTSVVGEVLEGLQSLKIAKSAADGQGEGTSVLSKTIDRADRGKPFYVYLSYDATHANFVRGDLKVYAYDVTNSQLLDVVNDSNNGELLQQKGLFSGVIFPQDTCTQVRLIVHCTSTNASAWNVFIDEVTITPQANIVGPVMTNWETYTPTFTGFGTVTTSSFYWRRNGPNMEIRGRFTLGTPTAVEARLSLPNSYISSSNIASSLEVCGTVVRATTGTVALYCLIEPSTSYLTFGIQGSGATGITKSTGSNLVTSGDVSLTAVIPILNWSAGASLTANDAGLQTIKVRAYKNGGTYSSASDVSSWTASSVDNYQTFNTTNGTFTAPKSGEYHIHWHCQLTGALTSYPNILVNGVSVAAGTSTGTTGSNFVSTLIRLSKGDVVTFRGSTSSGTIASTDVGCVLSIESIPDFNVFGVQGPIIVGTQTDWTPYTPTFSGFGTVSTSAFEWRRDGADVIIRGRFVAGTVQATEAQVTLPSGYTSKSTIATLEVAGVYGQSAVGAVSQYTAIEASKTYFVFTRNDADENSNTKLNGTNVTSTGGTVTISIRVPIQGWSSETRLYPTQRVIGTTYLKDVKSSGTNGGTFTSGAYQTRELNTQEGDTGFCSLSSNQFTLQPGTYEIEASAPAHRTARHKAKIRNITDSIDAILGTSEYESLPSGGFTAEMASNRAVVRGRIVITSSKTFELQHRCQTTAATSGFGTASSFGDNELYSEIRIDKIY